MHRFLNFLFISVLTLNCLGCAGNIPSNARIAVGSITSVRTITQDEMVKNTSHTMSYTQPEDDVSWTILNNFSNVFSGLTRKTILEYTVRLDNGREVTIRDDDDKPLRIGQRVVVEIDPDHEPKIAAY